MELTYNYVLSGTAESPFHYIKLHDINITDGKIFFYKEIVGCFLLPEKERNLAITKRILNIKFIKMKILPVIIIYFHFLLCFYDFLKLDKFC